jgi:hypothetical protein
MYLMDVTNWLIRSPGSLSRIQRREIGEHIYVRDDGCRTFPPCASSIRDKFRYPLWKASISGTYLSQTEGYSAGW